MKSIEYDPNSEASLKQAMNKIKMDLGELRIRQTGKTRKDTSKELEVSIQTILDCDISSVYGLSSLLDKREYYVYFHCDPSRIITGSKWGMQSAISNLGVTCLPFYVGKGKGNRCDDLDRNDTHRKIRTQILARNKDIVVHKVLSGLTEFEALALESKLIDLLGLRINGGWLVNLDEGVRHKERREFYKEHLVKLNDHYKQIYSPSEKTKRKLLRVAAV